MLSICALDSNKIKFPRAIVMFWNGIVKLEY